MNCGHCKAKLTSRAQTVSCDGFCEEQFHIACCGIPSESLKFLEKVDGFKWFCSNCSPVTDRNQLESFKKLFHENINKLFGEMENHFVQLKNDITKLAVSKWEEMNEQVKKEVIQITENNTIRSTPIESSSQSRTYSGILKSKSAIIVKPKEVTQKNYQTKVDLLHQIDPKEQSLHISSIKNINNGGVVINCSNDSETIKLQNLANSKLSDNYEIKSVETLRPRIRVVGMSEKLNEDTLIGYIKHQNRSLISSENAEINVIKLWPTKKNQNIYQAVLQVDVTTYNKIICTGKSKLFVGFDFCEVYDHIILRRCFKCNAYNHTSMKCGSKISCPRCSEEHQVKDCKVADTELRCINCVKLGDRTKNKDIDINHASWDTRCRVYQQNVVEFKSKIYDV